MNPQPLMPYKPLTEEERDHLKNQLPHLKRLEFNDQDGVLITGGLDFHSSSSSAFPANYVDFFLLDSMSWTRLDDSSYGQWGHKMAIYNSYEIVEETRSPRPIIIGGEYELLDETGMLETHYRNWVFNSDTDICTVAI